MMISNITDKTVIYECLKRDPIIYAYHIGDLDDYFFEYCRWYGLFNKNTLEEVILVFSKGKYPTVLSFGNSEKLETLLTEILPKLPDRFFCHYQKGIEKVFKKRYEVSHLGTHQKMSFQGEFPETTRIQADDLSHCRLLNASELEEIVEFYQEAHPGNYFIPFMIETNKYFGIEMGNKLVSIAGVHVYSQVYNVAVLGNIATHPDYRSRGLAKKCISKLLSTLIGEVDFISLNVKGNNQSAINLYTQLGFVKYKEYEEALLTKLG